MAEVKLRMQELEGPVPLTHKEPCHFSVSLPLQWDEAASLGKGGPGDGSLDGC